MALEKETLQLVESLYLKVEEIKVEKNQPHKLLVTPLKGKSQFDKIFKEPDLIVNHGYLKIILKKNNLEEIKLGLIVPKKNLSLAARRNYVKRSARELARNNIFLGYDLIFLLIDKIKVYSKQEIRNNIFKLKRKIQFKLNDF